MPDAMSLNQANDSGWNITDALSRPVLALLVLGTLLLVVASFMATQVLTSSHYQPDKLETIRWLDFLGRSALALGLLGAAVSRSPVSTTARVLAVAGAGFLASHTTWLP